MSRPGPNDRIWGHNSQPGNVCVGYTGRVEVIGNVLSAERFATAGANAAPMANRIVGG